MDRTANNIHRSIKNNRIPVISGGNLAPPSHYPIRNPNEGNARSRVHGNGRGTL